MSTKKFGKYLVFLADLVAMNLALAFIFWLRYRSGFSRETFEPGRNFLHYAQLALILSVAGTAYFYLKGLYRDWSLHSRAVQVAVVTRDATLFSLLVFAVTSGSYLLDALRHHQLHRVITFNGVFIVLSYWIIVLIFVNGCRLLAQMFVRSMLTQGQGQDRLFILGATEAGEHILNELVSAPELGWKAVGFVDENPAMRGQNFTGLPVLGKYAELPDLIRTYKPGGIIISHESSSHNEILRVLSYVVEFPLTIFIVPDLYDAASGHFKTNAVHGIALKELFPEHMPGWEADLKRLIDITASIFGMILTGPIMLVLIFIIRWDSVGPAFYSQERVGQYGRRFRLYKFRTMRTDAEAAGPQWASKKDPRITRLGRILRRSRLDELPQFWNVLRGDMSLVGPRPEREHFINQLRHEVPLYLRRLKMKPGLTGWAQIKHQYDSSIEDVKTKVLFDLWYFENMSVPLDIMILLRTIWVVLTGKGAH